MTVIPTRREQIDSHSSLLTNELILEIEKDVCEAESAAWYDPYVLETARVYWSRMQTQYVQFSPFFVMPTLTECKEDLEKLWTEGLMLSLNICAGTSTDALRLNWVTLRLHILVRYAGQVLSYWTRMSKVDPKGMKEHIDMFDRINPLEVKKNARVRKVDKDAAAAADKPEPLH